MHLEIGRAVVANVVDHITAHRGDMGRFLDTGNLQSLCKPCHDGHKQAQEHNAGGILRGAGHGGQPLDLAHPWYQNPPQGGDEKSQPPQLRTGHVPSSAGPRNG